MVYTLTLNPCIDYYMDINELVLSDVNRSKSEKLAVGGKGINVSLALCAMGIENIATGIVGGVTAPLFLTLLEQQGVKGDFITDDKFITRINPKILSTSGVTECNGSGAVMSRELFERMKEKLVSMVSDGDTVVISGNNPPCQIENVYGELITALKKKKVFIIADTSGDELMYAAKAGADLLKPNVTELCQLYNCPSDMPSLSGAILKLMSEGAGSVLLSMGEKGALLFTKERKYIARVPRVGDVSSTVGAGDCSVAGYVYALLQGFDDIDRISCAIAAGTTRTCSHSFFDPDIFNKLKNMVHPAVTR